MAQTYIQNSASCSCGCGGTSCNSTGLPLPVMNFAPKAADKAAKASRGESRDSDWLPTVNRFVQPSPKPTEAVGLPLPSMGY